MTTAIAGLLMLAAGLVWALRSGTHPTKKPDGFEGPDGSSPGAHDGLSPDAGNFAVDGRRNAPASGRSIDLSRALVKGRKPTGGSGLPEDSGSFPGI